MSSADPATTISANRIRFVSGGCPVMRRTSSNRRLLSIADYLIAAAASRSLATAPCRRARKRANAEVADPAQDARKAGNGAGREELEASCPRAAEYPAMRRSSLGGR